MEKIIKIDTNYKYNFYRRDNLSFFAEKVYPERLDKRERNKEIKEMTELAGTSVLMREVSHERLSFCVPGGTLVEILGNHFEPEVELITRAVYSTT